MFFNRCRIVIEHGHALQMARTMEERFGGPRIPTVDIIANPIERRIFAPFLFNYHCCHHLFMSVPHYNLPKLYSCLKRREYDGHHELSEGYVAALKTVIVS